MAVRKHNRGFTRLELAVVVVVLAALVLLIVPTLSKARSYGNHVKCADNQKLIGSALGMFAKDHGDQYPFQLPDFSSNPGSRETWLCFYAMSNELSLPKFLVCPTDALRLKTMALDFGANTNGLMTFQNQSVSYFIGLDASEKTPTAILLGDRNVTIPGNEPVGALLTVRSNQMLHWGSDLHVNRGNLVFSDGSVQQVVSGYAPPAPGTATGNQRLLLPLVKPSLAERRAEIDFWVGNPR